MENIQLTFPDGKTKEFPRGSTALDVAKSIGPRLAAEALVGAGWMNILLKHADFVPVSEMTGLLDFAGERESDVAEIGAEQVGI